MKNLIYLLKGQLDKEMHEICKDFLYSDRNRYSPRYYNFGKINDDTGGVVIQSTEMPSLSFEVAADVNIFDFDPLKFWDEFKQYRTKFIKENYPEIKAY